MALPTMAKETIGMDNTITKRRPKRSWRDDVQEAVATREVTDSTD